MHILCMYLRIHDKAICKFFTWALHTHSVHIHIILIAFFSLVVYMIVVYCFIFFSFTGCTFVRFRSLSSWYMLKWDSKRRDERQQQQQRTIIIYKETRNCEHLLLVPVCFEQQQRSVNIFFNVCAF